MSQLSSKIILTRVIVSSILGSSILFNYGLLGSVYSGYRSSVEVVERFAFEVRLGNFDRVQLVGWLRDDPLYRSNIDTAFNHE